MESIKELRKICQNPDPKNVEVPNNFLYTKTWRMVSIYITKLLLYTPIQANHVTMFMIFWGFIVGFLFSIGTYRYMIIGALALEFYWVLDTIDGEIARYRKVFSFEGLFLDLMAHLTNISLPFLGITIGLYKMMPDFYILIAGLLVTTFSLLFLNVQVIKHQVIVKKLVRAAKKKEQIESKTLFKKIIKEPTQKNILKSIAKKVNIFYDHIYIIQVIFLGAIFGKLHWVLYFYAISFPLLWLAKLIYEYKIGYGPYEYLFKPYKK